MKGWRYTSFLGMSPSNSMKPGARISFPFSTEKSFMKARYILFCKKGFQRSRGRYSEIFSGESHQIPCFVHASQDACRTDFHRKKEAFFHLSFPEADGVHAKMVKHLYLLDVKAKATK